LCKSLRGPLTGKFGDPGVECGFEQHRGHAKLLGFLINFQSMQEAEIRKHTAELEAALTVITIKQTTDGDVVTQTTKDVDG